MIKASEFTAPEHNLYILRGGDVYFLDKAVSVIRHEADGGFLELNYQVFSENTSIAEIADFAATLPAFSGKKAGIIQGFSRKLTDNDKNALLEVFKNADKSVILAVKDSANDYKFLEKVAVVVDCKKGTPAELYDLVLREAAARGADIETPAVSLLIEYSDSDAGRIRNEIAKLASYTARISKEDVEVLVTPGLEYSVFDFANEIAAGANERALYLLTNLLDKGNHPTVLLSILAGQFRRMLLFTLSQGTDEAVAQTFNVKPYAVKINRQTAKKYGTKRLKYITDTLYEYEYKMKSTGTDPKELLKEAAACIMVQNRSRR